jgi:hypothetical protein
MSARSAIASYRPVTQHKRISDEPDESFRVAIGRAFMPAFSPALITIMRTVLEEAMTKVPAEHKQPLQPRRI